MPDQPSAKSNEALIMVAPNGARRTKIDHRQLPITAAEIAETAEACWRAGAGAFHLHVRDDEGKHTLDPGRYREAISAVEEATDRQMAIQVTTEAVGLYRPEEQVAVVEALAPTAVSVALRELYLDRSSDAIAGKFYRWAREAGIAVQHILYSPDEVIQLSALISRGMIPGDRHAAIFVLGRYTTDQQSRPEDLDPFVRAMEGSGLSDRLDWMVCAFGVAETTCLAYALARGGHARVGFENSLWNADGSLALSNEQRVGTIGAICDLIGRGHGRASAVMSILGKP